MAKLFRWARVLLVVLSILVAAVNLWHAWHGAQPPTPPLLEGIQLVAVTDQQLKHRLL